MAPTLRRSERQAASLSKVSSATNVTQPKAPRRGRTGSRKPKGKVAEEAKMKATKKAKGKAAIGPGQSNERPNITRVELHPVVGKVHDLWHPFRTLRDEAGNRIIYWGFNPSTGTSTRTTSIFILDGDSYQSEDITAELNYRPSEGEPIKRPLPDLRDPSVVLAKPDTGETFLVIFGGEVQGMGLGNSKLYYVDIKRREWGEIQPEDNSTPPLPRVGAAACVIDSTFYMFGGEIRGSPARSYTVGRLSFHREVKQLRCDWVQRDTKYPSHIPFAGYFGGCVLLDGGKYILLLPGGSSDPEMDNAMTVNFPKERELTLYNTDVKKPEPERFTRISSGPLQNLEDASWYNMMPAPASLLDDLPKFSVPGWAEICPTTFLIMVVPKRSDNGHMVHLWAVCVSPQTSTVKCERMTVEKDVKRIWARTKEKVEILGFFTTRHKMAFLGEGQKPVKGSPYVAEIIV